MRNYHLLVFRLILDQTEVFVTVLQASVCLSLMISTMELNAKIFFMFLYDLKCCKGRLTVSTRNQICIHLFSSRGMKGFVTVCRRPSERNFVSAFIISILFTKPFISKLNSLLLNYAFL